MSVRRASSLGRGRNFARIVSEAVGKDSTDRFAGIPGSDSRTRIGPGRLTARKWYRLIFGQATMGAIKFADRAGSSAPYPRCGRAVRRRTSGFLRLLDVSRPAGDAGPSRRIESEWGSDPLPTAV